MNILETLNGVLAFLNDEHNDDMRGELSCLIEELKKTTRESRSKFASYVAPDDAILPAREQLRLIAGRILDDLAASDNSDSGSPESPGTPLVCERYRQRHARHGG